MADYACIVQAGQISDATRAELVLGLERIAAEMLDAPSSSIGWVFIARGFGFSAGEPSTTSLVVRSVPIGFPDDRRQRLLTRISDFWQQATGCTANEVVVTALDGPLPI